MQRRILTLMIGSALSCAHAAGVNTASSVAVRTDLAPASAAVTLKVPAAPTPVHAADRTVLAYELHVANLGTRTVDMVGVEVRGDSSPIPLVSWDYKTIAANSKLIGERGASPPKNLAPGVRAVLYFWVELDTTASVPATLTHNVVFSDASRIGTTVAVRRSSPVAITSPVGAGDWWMGLGPSANSEHRRAVVRVGDDTVPHLAQRFAIDWVKVDAEGEYARDKRGARNEDWYGFGEPVYAVADARVALTLDSIPDNVPGEGSRAVAMKAATVLGNYVLLDLGPGEGASHLYALFGHLKRGSVAVHTGDVVRRGQQLGTIGNSGNSDGPHLHFHVTETSDVQAAPLRAEGVPFVLDNFSVIEHDPELVAKHQSLTSLGAHVRALPVEGDVIRTNGPRS